MKKIAIVLIILIITTGLFIAIIKRPFGSANNVFSIESADMVQRVIISSGQERVKITRQDEKWYVNDSLKARPGAISFLLKTLEDISIKSPVSDYLFDELTGSESTEHIEVEVYGKRKILRSFSVYRINSPEYPGIMQKRSTTEPFFMHMPGYDTDPSTHFVADKRFWLPFTLFRLEPGELSEVHMKYYGQPDSSFSITLTENGIRFINGEYTRRDIDSMALGRYLTYFTYVPFEGYEYNIDSTVRDSIIRNNPYFNLKVITIDSDVIDLVTWKRKIRKGSIITDDTDRMWGSLNRGEDLLIIKYFDIDPLIKGPSYFISE